LKPNIEVAYCSQNHGKWRPYRTVGLVGLGCLHHQNQRRADKFIKWEREISGAHGQDRFMGASAVAQQEAGSPSCLPPPYSLCRPAGKGSRLNTPMSNRAICVYPNASHHKYCPSSSCILLTDMSHLFPIDGTGP